MPCQVATESSCVSAICCDRLQKWRKVTSQRRKHAIWQAEEEEEEEEEKEGEVTSKIVRAPVRGAASSFACQNPGYVVMRGTEERGDIMVEVGRNNNCTRANKRNVIQEICMTGRFWAVHLIYILKLITVKVHGKHALYG